MILHFVNKVILLPFAGALTVMFKSYGQPAQELGDVWDLYQILE